VRLLAADPPIERVYSSLYYRCLQTVEPFVRKAQDAGPSTAAETRPLIIRGETGLGEWYGSADFEHPVPASLETLDPLFPGLLDLDYGPAVTPNRRGEGIEELHDRVAVAVEALIAQCDRDGVRAILLCSHAAVIIALGRVLTGKMPGSLDVEDFKCFTCGLSTYRRRQRSRTETKVGLPGKPTDAHNVDHGKDGQVLDWRGGRGVADGWDCELNSDCSHLSLGEERGWSVFLGFPAFRAGLTRDAGSFREMSPSRTWRQAGACWIPERDWELAQMSRARIPEAERRAPGASFSVAGSTVGGLSGIYCVQLSYPRIYRQAQACHCTNKYGIIPCAMSVG
jgi:transcription factor C subunit 7